MLISLLEVAERAQTGAKMRENEWNLGMFRKMQEFSYKYRLQVSARIIARSLTLQKIEKRGM